MVLHFVDYGLMGLPDFFNQRNQSGGAGYLQTRVSSGIGQRQAFRVSFSEFPEFYVVSAL